MTAPFTTADLAACAEREVKQRLYVFPKHVAAGKRTQKWADREIAMMTEIARRLRAEADANPQASGKLL